MRVTDLSLKEKAETLLSLHTGGAFLVLPNIWDPLGARILEAKGYPAVATASAALSASLGFEDGERISRGTLLDYLRRIAGSVKVPVTADIEAGYGDSVAELEETIRLVIEAGVVGVNIQDSLDGDHTLRPVGEQCRRLAAARRVADRAGVHLVVNARTDPFLSTAFRDRARALDECAGRAPAYVDAGADCIYPIGPGDEATARALRERIGSPINILGSPRAAPLRTLRAIGVNRVSFGPYPFRACLRRFVEIAEALQAEGDYACLDGVLSPSEVAPYLRHGLE